MLYTEDLRSARAAALSKWHYETQFSTVSRNELIEIFRDLVPLSVAYQLKEMEEYIPNNVTNIARRPFIKEIVTMCVDSHPLEIDLESFLTQPEKHMQDREDKLSKLNQNMSEALDSVESDESENHAATQIFRRTMGDLLTDHERILFLRYLVLFYCRLTNSVDESKVAAGVNEKLMFNSFYCRVFNAYKVFDDAVEQHDCCRLIESIDQLCAVGLPSVLSPTFIFECLLHEFKQFEDEAIFEQDPQMFYLLVRKLLKFIKVKKPAINEKCEDVIKLYILNNQLFDAFSFVRNITATIEEGQGQTNQERIDLTKFLFNFSFSQDKLPKQLFQLPLERDEEKLLSQCVLDCCKYADRLPYAQTIRTLYILSLLSQSRFEEAHSFFNKTKAFISDNDGRLVTLLGNCEPFNDTEDEFWSVADTTENFQEDMVVEEDTNNDDPFFTPAKVHTNMGYNVIDPPKLLFPKLPKSTPIKTKSVPRFDTPTRKKTNYITPSKIKTPSIANARNESANNDSNNVTFPLTNDIPVEEARPLRTPHGSKHGKKVRAVVNSSNTSDASSQHVMTLRSARKAPKYN